MVNDNQKATSRGILLELIYDICASEAAICHDYESLMLFELDLKEKEEVNSILISSKEDNSEVLSDIQNIKEKISNIEKLIHLETETRREKQSLLEKLSKNYDKRFHCKIKHWCRVIEHDLELLESYEYSELSNIIKKDFENFALTLSMYLGIEYTDCYRCISDMI